MLRFFRINDPYRLLGLLVILILLYIPFFINGPALTVPELRSMLVGERLLDGSVPFSSLTDSTGPISAWFFALIDAVFGRSLTARHIFGFLILFSQSAYIGTILINKKAFSENTYLPSFIFSVLAFFSFDVLSLSSELIGCGFLLLALSNLFKEIEFRTQRDETIFNLGIYVGLASLCNFSFVIHLLSVCAILIIYTRTSVRGFLLLVFGFVLPHFIVISLYYLNGNLSQLWQYFYLPNVSFGPDKLMGSYSLFILGAVPLFFLLVSMVMLNREARFTKYQSQLLQSMFVWIIFSFLQVLYARDLRPQSFITLIPGFCFFLTHFLLLIRRKRFAEVGIWMLLCGVASVSYMAYFNKISSVDYQSLYVKKDNSGIVNKRVLVLGDEFNIYQNNTQATPFLDWNLSREILEHPDYYENVITVYNAFKSDPPEIIYDKKRLITKFFDRIPAIRGWYKEVSTGVFVRRVKPATSK
ncbi:MAG TPA: hypothetical protein VL443_12195 [Cyclobacteriaceae bacterium]|nr:hypothetical protein [Cyclobacteriaceae bacterium]